uniref:CCHC-type domain-containing protein n=1 Tax=Globodera rostochiensis TaxID=31243 RepID=A0A914I3J8_GLORO
MFDYDRELNIAQQLAEKTDDNAIVHGLEGLLRRCSSPNNGFHQLGQFRQKSASVGSDHLYSTQFLSKRPPHHLFDGLKNSFASNGTSLDMQNTFRRLSGGSAGTLADAYECDTSSGYGSLLGTPLASPAMSSAQFHAAQLQKMFMDPGISEEEEIALDKQDMASFSHAHHFVEPDLSPPPQTLSAVQRRRMATMPAIGIAKAPAPPPHPTLLMTNTTTAHNNGSTATLLKATTTTTGTNKNSNKRKTSLNTTVGQNNSNNTNNGGGAGITTAEDGFDFREIKEFTQLLHSPRRVPPPRYICHICYQPGHYISDCPARFNSPYEELTPYQGRKKCYGEFQCEQCKRKWTSQNSVANEAQSCIKCHVPVFPHKQLPVDKAVALGLVKLQRLPVTNIGSSSSTENLFEQGSVGLFLDESSGNSFIGTSDSSSSSPSLTPPMMAATATASLMI